MLAMGTDSSHYIDEITNALDKYQVPYESLSRERLKERYAINLPGDASGVLDPSGGILRADKAVQAFQVSIVFYSLLIFPISYNFFFHWSLSDKST